MNKRAKMTSLYGADSTGDDELVYTIEDDGEIRGHDYMSYQEWRQDKETVGIDAHWIPVAIVDHIKQEGVDEMDEVKPYVGVTNGEAEALAFMAHTWGNLYVEVLMSYTTLIQGGMRPGPAAYAALISWDISVEEA